MRTEASASHERVPILPVLSAGAFIKESNELQVPAVDDMPHVAVSSGSAAIALALMHAGIGSEHKVLLPAFHCPSMAEAVLGIGATPVYYKIRPDTSFDIDSIAGLLDRQTKAILVVHYFGFPSDLKSVCSVCNSHNMVLIEDCAHCFFGQLSDRPVGTWGDYAIASTSKFFPVMDGGLICSSRVDLEDLKTYAPGALLNAKALLGIVEKSVEHKRLGALRPIVAGVAAVRAAMRTANVRSTAADDYDTLETPIADALGSISRKRMTLPSRMVARLAARSRVVVRRRRNYQYLENALSDLIHGRPLRPKLPECVVPYMFPFLVDRPNPVYRQLKREGVAIWRWDHSDKSCPVSADYATRLLQIPCHQELRGCQGTS